MLNPESYFLNWQAVPMFVVSTLIFSIGLFVFLQNQKSSPNLFFFLFCLSLNLWLYGRVLMYCSKDADNALHIAKVIAKIGVFNIAPLVYTFSVMWLNLYEKQKKFVIAAFIASPLFYIITLTTPYGITGVRKYFWGYYPIYGPVCKVFLVFFFTYFFAAFYNFFSALRAKTEDPIRKKQIQLITFAFVVSFTASADYLPKIVVLPLYPFGYISVLIWTIVVAYSIAKYRTFDIQTVLHKTIMWFLASSVLGAPMIAFYYFNKEWVYHLHPSLFLLLLAFSFILVVLYTRHIQPHIDHIFQRRLWDLTRAMEKFTDDLVHLKNLEDVGRHIVHTVTTLLYARNVTLLVRNNQTQKFDVVTSDNGAAKNLSLDLNDPFFEWSETYDNLIFKEYLTLDPRLQPVQQRGQEYFESLGAIICIPLVVNQNLVGVLNLGDKENLRRYYSAEVTFLSDFRRNAGIALSNALHILAMQENLRRWNEELEKKVIERTDQLANTQAQLIQAEKLATIGTLAGGVAHEINNPLTAVLTNAQILKMTVTGEDLESIELIEEGAKRCQVIIQSLLKYARKSVNETLQGEVQLQRVVQNVCSLLAYQLKQENIEVIQNLDEVEPIIGISNELEQVLTNLIINARDAIRKVGRSDGKIDIRISQKDKTVQLQVKDNGSGIEKGVLSKIFDPFFTTKDVGSGTGLGLAVSHSIIEKHNGRVQVESEVDVGTRFTLYFPKAHEKSSRLTKPSEQAS